MPPKTLRIQADDHPPRLLPRPSRQTPRPGTLIGTDDGLSTDLPASLSFLFSRFANHLHAMHLDTTAADHPANEPPAAV
ncbi:hypothetical protein Dda_4213 [Drechslerella dactyloides]|uniref:Uncharacterized protein n=1 Tax=Drechslerella dactyloides TaxID=74499 RepID=A0AAD6IZC0_DREDA|nr:hypothetical protein Dda_4213 [Drechslerella dactyloides]